MYDFGTTYYYLNILFKPYLGSVLSITLEYYFGTLTSMILRQCIIKMLNTVDTVLLNTDPFSIQYIPAS